MINRTPIDWTAELTLQAEELCRVAHECARRGWLPATAGNFSFRDRSAKELSLVRRVFISPSGIDKGSLTLEDLLEIDAGCRVIAGNRNAKPSAETSLHGVIYRERPEAGAIFHVHTVANTLLSERAVGGELVLEGYELLKALSGVTTHEHCERVPVLANSQDYAQLSSELGSALKANGDAHGVLLVRHGLYAWGDSIAETWRHLEALEFLFDVELRRELN